ncbi:MAG: HNH endonuclease, partial [Chloroflexota bacterium]|nr:HNH endonuclease [Chloroflexota bacterium]
VYLQVHLTYGYLTKHTRITHQLEKSHMMDARCISSHPLAVSDGTWYLIKQVRRNNRHLHKATIRKGGIRQRNTASKEVHGFRLFDGVKYQTTMCFVFGRRRSGYFDLRLLDGTKVHASASSKHLQRIQRASTCLIERRSGVSSQHLKAGGSPRHNA